MCNRYKLKYILLSKYCILSVNVSSHLIIIFFWTYLIDFNIIIIIIIQHLHNFVGNSILTIIESNFDGL